MPGKWKSLLSLVVVVSLFLIPEPSSATESRIIGGEGLIGDPSLASSIWRIGLCSITAGQDFGFHVAETANSAWPGAFAQSGAFKVVIMPELNPSALTPNDIINLGEEYGVDALLWGSVDQAKNRLSAWSMLGNTPRNEVAVTISFRLYETTTGSLMWERVLKKDRTVSTIEAEGILERFAANIVTDMVDCLIADGITGRDLSLNNPPQISTSAPMLVFRTSAARLRATVTDDFGIGDISVSCGEGQTLGSWQADPATEFEFDLVLTRNQVSGKSLLITARDNQGAEAQLEVPVSTDVPSLEGMISTVTADTVFINIGSNAGVEPGMLFSVETLVDIVDPATGTVLGSSRLETGKLEVESVEQQFAACHVIQGNITDMKPGDRVF